jgi:hypothetical protein
VGYQFNIDDEPLSDERIDRHKDFQKVMLRFRKEEMLVKRKLYKDRRFWWIVLLFGLLAYLVFQAIEEEKNKPATPINQSIHP